MSPTARTRLLLLAVSLPLVIVVVVLAVAGTGSDDGIGSAPAPASPAERPHAGFLPPGATATDLGGGPTGGVVLRPRPTAHRRPAVLFLHGWTATDPGTYGDWIAHLVRRGSPVVYPIYQEPPFIDTVSPLTNVILAVRAAVRRVGLTDGLVVAGHSAGGALAVDYAASARAAGLPRPASVLSVYPGRSLPGIPVQIPAVGGARIPPATRVIVLAGDDDKTVGTRGAREIAGAATRARTTFRLVRDDAVDDHVAPLRADAAARRTFWGPLDALVERAGAAGRSG